MTDRLPKPEEATDASGAGARPSAYTLALNVLPLVHVVVGVGLLAAMEGEGARVAAGLAWVYLFPPLTVRAALGLGGGCEGTGLAQSSRAYKLWWFATQMQVLFNRLPALEEVLRVVPGFYALWLRLWGSRVSTRVYWGPGALVTDRSFVDIGAAVVVGTRAVLAPHLGYRDDRGEFRVTVGRISIGDEVMIGGNAGIGPGCRVEAGAQVPAAAFLRPYTHWRRDRRGRGDRPRVHS